MAAGLNYTVLEADYLDELEGLVRGTAVPAEPGSIQGQLLVTHIGEDGLKQPIAVHASQLQAAA